MKLPRWKKPHYEIKCHKCATEWKTVSVRMYVSCPNCGAKARNIHGYPEDELKNV